MIQLNKKKVPITSDAGRPLKYPFSTMEVGDSFTVKSTNYSALTCAIKWAERNKTSWKFKGSLVKGQLTVWRIK